MLNLNLKYGFNANVQYSKRLNYIPKKVNILISNHPSTFDFTVIFGMLKELNMDKIYVVGKKSLMFIPGLGFSFLYGQDIKLDRNWELDEKNIEIQLNNIDEGIILIYPEGTTFTPDKLKDCQKYSQDNNLQVLNNLLTPKSKGLWSICNMLKKHNKLGNIMDMTIILENYVGQKAFLSDVIKKSYDNIYIINENIELPQDITDYNNFKSWLYNIWIKKDKIMNNYLNYDFIKFQHKIDELHLVIVGVIIILTTIGLFDKDFRYYILGAILLSYIFTIKKYFYPNY